MDAVYHLPKRKRAMETTELCNFFKWCFIINAGIFVFWFVVYLTARDTIYRIHARWFELSKEQFVSVHYRLMGQYKLAIFLLNLVPWIALLILAD
jgi:hypothetical protein